MRTITFFALALLTAGLFTSCQVYIGSKVQNSATPRMERYAPRQRDDGVWELLGRTNTLVGLAIGIPALLVMVGLVRRRG